MSENIPSTSALMPSSPNRPARKIRKKHDKLKLPTPPPDPREKKSCTKNEFLEYLEHLQKHTANYSTSTSTLASALIAEDAFDHLEKLYKLMEQMLELRAQNAKLHRKIRDLEHMNNLEKMYKQVENLAESEACPELEKDTAFAETILESILYDPKPIPRTKGSMRQSLIGKHRNRSCSATDKPIGLDNVQSMDYRRASLCVGTGKKPSKVSKWTKVKAAFKWEKASTTVGDSKSLDSGISGITPIEIARYLRVPSTTNDDSSHSPIDSGGAEISTPGTLSSASSNENFHKTVHRNVYEDPRSSDDEHSHVHSSHSKEDPNISPRSSQRSHRTPWARMKDIINTRNPVRKKSRLSTHSDDIQIDIELCSDNEEDVFEENPKLFTSSNSAATSCGKLDSENDIPLDVRERYKMNNENLMETDFGECRKISKWTKVKKAFLPAFDNLDISGMKDDLYLNTKDPIQSEINRNYRHLQKKLSIEFQEKLHEWKKIKQNTSCVPNPVPSCSNVEDQSQSTAFMKKIEEWEKIKSQPVKSKSSIQMTSESNLPPEFKKKLQEWEKMKKSSVRKSTKKVGDTPRWKCAQNARSDTAHIEIPVISEEFKKKLDEWKQIKAMGYKSDEGEKKNIGDKTPSPKLQRLDSKFMKQQQDKELQWYEKELNKIEKEKNRLERERQKFMDREEKLSKLKKSISGGCKKDILVHTPCGSYKFEGISRKFTRKLYEWEKSKGIGPESSTFAFLAPDLAESTIPTVKINGTDQAPIQLARSRSVDSVAIPTMNSGCPLVSQPSSLSLNDVEEFEKKCLLNSKSSSIDYLPCQCRETEIDEPEALIVEVEDFVEETAAPLKSFVEQHNPVYQREEVRALCEGETCLAPKIRRSESARAQTNYNLIETILNVLRNISENEVEIRKIQIVDQLVGASRVKELCIQQKTLVDNLMDKLQKLQEENSVVVSNLTRENQNSQSKNIIDILEVVQDLSLEIILLAEKLDTKIANQIDEEPSWAMFDELHAQEIIDEIKNKLLELRRHLSYVCAASDSTTPLKKRLCRMKSVVSEKLSNDSQRSTSTMSQSSSEQHPKTCGIYTKSESRNAQSQGAVKKKIRYRIENIRRKSLQDSDEDEDLVNREQKRYSKCMKIRKSSEASVKTIELDEDKNMNIFPAVSMTTYPESPSKIYPTDSPVTIFVKTTRKLFTPFIERGLKDIDLRQQLKTKGENEEKLVNYNNDDKNNDLSSHVDVQNSGITSLPPLPASPIPQRRHLKDMSPGIRLMLAKYNQKLSEQDTAYRSGGSSGSASPVAWRSPIAERRVKAQTEKYQEEITKLLSLSSKRDIQKSASQGCLGKKEQISDNDNHLGSTLNRNNSILKSSSAANLILRKIDQRTISSGRTAENLNVPKPICEENTNTSRHSSELRLQKLKKAKEDFLNSKPNSTLSSPTDDVKPYQYRTRNRLSQISVESSSSAGSISPGLLVKSISAGMINIAEEAYRQFEEGTHRGYVSLPRDIKSGTTKKFALSNIASKFRKVKMRRGKDKGKENFPVVSELCRQSLVVDINENNQRNGCSSEPDISGEAMGAESSVAISKSSSWIRRAKFFKKFD